MEELIHWIYSCLYWWRCRLLPAGVERWFIFQRPKGASRAGPNAKVHHLTSG